MKKGQLFILAAFVIVMGIGALANFATTIPNPAIKDQTNIGSPSLNIHNIETELVYVTRMGPTNTSRIDDFRLIIGNYTQDKSLISETTRSYG
jgi:hypothetical protein